MRSKSVSAAVEFLGTSNTHASFSCPEVFDLDESALRSTYNTRPKADQGNYSTGRERSEPENRNSLDSLESKPRFRSCLQRNDSGCPKPCELKRGRSSRRIPVEQRQCIKINLVLDILPWIVGFIWVATTFFGGR